MNVYPDSFVKGFNVFEYKSVSMSVVKNISNKCSIAIHCLIFINEYGNKQKVTSELLALSTGCNPVTIRNIISRLNKERLIDVKFGTGGARIAVPLSEISLYKVCDTVDPDALDKMIGIHGTPSPFCPVGKNIKPVLNHAYDSVKMDMIESMKRITLDTMVDDFHQIIDTAEQ